MPINAPQTSQEHGVTTRRTTAHASAAHPPTATPSAPDPVPAAMQRFRLRSLRRSSSRIQRWVQDQQKRYSSGDDVAPDPPSASDAPDAASGCHPYLAYPHLALPRPSEEDEDVITLDDDFVHIDSDDARVTEVVDLSSAPPTPRRNRAGTITFATPSPLRTLARNLAHSRRISSSTTTTVREQSPSPSRPSIFPRPSRTSIHSRASSRTTSLFTQRPQRDAPSEDSMPPSSSTWKFKRTPGGLLSHFAASSEGTLDDGARPPRPSTESSISRSSETTYTRNSLESTSTSSPLRSMRAHTPSMFFNATPSLWSLPRDASHMNDPPESEKTIARDTEKGSMRMPIHLKGSSGSSSGSILSSHKRRRKRKLVVSGIPPGDMRRYEHVRLWCESFGELNQITRVPNGDLHVDFRRSEVADTVCRLHARVHINGVGSVGLSWFTGKRP
ncbi:hypothetical protein PHLGIDRAFT_115744 [Phlebiopsis gigantea 11061_1 CR5-6]|uniref:Uncharacterized protein n=1 Tax=Phlebiopsis gigantea (strain 11061_1 CR5-6) TaxID=745531 RepID=A0A0C3NXG4_PHLG1|nr:hypothetical protein PHLGIDRAFT_115744 [Phlebiopsis gigantea 11061_1 CR5-6]